MNEIFTRPSVDRGGDVISLDSHSLDEVKADYIGCLIASRHVVDEPSS